jgi:hypothetical protein
MGNLLLKTIYQLDSFFEIENDGTARTANLLLSEETPILKLEK